MRRFLFFTTAFSLTAFLVGAVLFHVSRVPSPDKVRRSFQVSDRAILDRRGQIIDEVRTDKSTRRLNWVELNEVPPAFVRALLLSEDERFFYHPGFNPLKLSSYTEDGPGTITQQVIDLIENARNADGAVNSQTERTFAQKINRVLKAIAWELSWNKPAILEAYVNLIAYRGELQGIGAASFGLFDKSPVSLTRTESAVLVALIRRPEAAADGVRERACELLAEMKVGDECALLSRDHLAYLEEGYRIRPYVKMAPQVAERLRDVRTGGLVRSTLDRDVQWAAIHSLQKQNRDGGIIVIENASGHVLAYAGHRGAKAEEDPVTVAHPAGALLKPFIFTRALDERIITASTALENVTVKVAPPKVKKKKTKRGAKVAKVKKQKPEAPNPGDFVTVKAAVLGDFLIPSARVLEMLGTETFVDSLSQLGFSEVKAPQFYGPSLAFGSKDVKLVELANAYRVLANNGVWTPLRFSPDVTSEFGPRRVYSQQAAFVMKRMLASNDDKLWSAGVSSGEWCILMTEKFTIGVRMEQGAVKVAREMRAYLHRQETSDEPRIPEGLVRSEDGEFYLTGTAPKENEPAPGVKSRISYPRDEALIALEEETPRPGQRLFIQIAAPRADQNVYLNGRRLGRAEPYLQWEPEAGKFLLELRDSRGQVVDRVRFEVREGRIKVAGQKPAN